MVTDKRGVQTKYEYSGERVSAVIEAFGTPEQRRTETDWNAPLDVVSERRVKAAGGTLLSKRTSTHNARRQITSLAEFDPIGAVTRTTAYTYCEANDVAAPQSTCPILGLLKTIDGPRGDVADLTTHAYYAATDESGCAGVGPCHRQGDLWKVTNALGHIVEILKYDTAGRVVSIKDANGVVTDTDYHARGWVAARKVRGANPNSESDDAITQYAYLATGQLASTTDPDGVTLSYEYDDAQRLTAIEDALGNRIEYTVDAAGNRTADVFRDSDGVVRRQLARLFDALGRLDQELDAQAQIVADPTYDAAGNQTATADALGRETHAAYDPLNRLRQTIQDHGGLAVPTDYEYDALDRLTAVTDPKGLDTTYTYTGLGDLTQLDSPDTGVTTYTYDAAGNRLTQTDARGITATYTYDALNRLTAIAYPDASENVSYHYDQNNAATGCIASSFVGRLTSFTDPSGSTTYCYDRRGNVAQKTQITNDLTLITAFTYTRGDKVAGMTYPSGLDVDYSRDSQGRIDEIEITPPGGFAQTLIAGTTYLPFGPVHQIHYANGRVQTRTYDTNYAIDSIGNAGSEGIHLDFTVDLLGNPEQITRGPQGNVFGYDALTRLQSVHDLANTPIEAYTYDATGNRLGKTIGAGPAQVYTYPGGSHRLASVAGIPRSYDNVGNLTGTGNGLLFTYSQANRLKSIAATSHLYNAKGERVAKTYEFAPENDRYFTYDQAGRLLDERVLGPPDPCLCIAPPGHVCPDVVPPGCEDPNPEFRKLLDSAPGRAPKDFEAPGPWFESVYVVQEYVWLDDLPVAVVHGNDIFYIESDHLGTPRAVFDPSTNLDVWTWDLIDNPFGEALPDEDPDGNTQPFVFNLRFPGQYFDSETGLHYNYRRDYEPSTGRYIEPDPMGLWGGIGGYPYVDGNPLRRTDRLGLSYTDYVFCRIRERASGAMSGDFGCQDTDPPIPMPEPYDPASPEEKCRFVCNTLVGVVCGPAAAAASTGTGMSTALIWTGCRLIVYGACAAKCLPDTCP